MKFYIKSCLSYQKMEIYSCTRVFFKQLRMSLQKYYRVLSVHMFFI